MNIIDLKAAASKDAKTVVAAACMGAAMPDRLVEATCKGVDLDAAHDLKVTRISDIFAAFGYEYRPGNDAEMTRAIKAAFSSADIPNVLSNVAQKFALAGFGAVGESWRDISRAVAVNNFKAVKGVRLVLGGLLESVGKGGELKHVDLSDEAREVQAATKGSIVGITERFGQMSGRTINKDVFGALPATGAAYGANTTGALNLDNLAAAYALAMGITDENGNPLGALPDRILCAPANYLLAKNIYQSEHIVNGSGKSPRDNVMRGVLVPVTSPFLSGTAYWLFNATFPLVDVAFLNGVQTPTVETAEANFSRLGIEMRCFYDYGVGAGDVKAALYSTGA